MYFLEPVARDWGRLRGGLTPWRTVLLGPGVGTTPPASRWWQRLLPFRRRLGWSYRGGAVLEKYAILDRLTQQLFARKCAVGWNADWQSWDLKVRRGALGEAQVRVVIEHHGGAKRLARLSAAIKQHRSFYWLQAGLIAGASAAAPAGMPLAAAVFGLLFVATWVAPILEANRLESVVRSTADEVVAALEPAARPG